MTVALEAVGGQRLVQTPPHLVVGNVPSPEGCYYVVPNKLHTETETLYTVDLVPCVRLCVGIGPSY